MGPTMIKDWSTGDLFGMGPTGDQQINNEQELWSRTGSGAHLGSCTVGTGGPFPGATARPGREAVHSPSSSAEVEKE
jgi:hypothetical protein